MAGIVVLLEVCRASEVLRAVGAGVPLPLPSFWQGNLLLLLLLAGDGGDGGDGGAALRILLLLLATGTNTVSNNHAKHHPHEHLGGAVVVHAVRHCGQAAQVGADALPTQEGTEDAANHPEEEAAVNNLSEERINTEY